MSNHARDETRQPEHEKEKEVVTAEVSDGGEEEQVVMVAEDGAGAGAATGRGDVGGGELPFSRCLSRRVRALLSTYP